MDVVWRHYFDVAAVERNVDQDPNTATIIKFDHAIVTDGVSVSIQVKRTRPVQPTESEGAKKRRLKELLFGAEQVYGIDTGKRLMYAGVRCNSDGSEDNVRMSSRAYHHRTGHYKRNKRRKKLTAQIDREMARDREQFQIKHGGDGDIPGPHSANYTRYVQHVLKFFSEAINAYTQREYALQDMLHHIDTNKVLEALATQLIGGKTTFVFVGKAFAAGKYNN